LQIIRVMGAGNLGATGWGGVLNEDDERKQTKDSVIMPLHVTMANNLCHYLSFTIMAFLHGQLASPLLVIASISGASQKKREPTANRINNLSAFIHSLLR